VFDGGGTPSFVWTFTYAFPASIAAINSDSGRPASGPTNCDPSMDPVDISPVRAPAPAVTGSVLVSAETGFGLDTLRAEIAALLASLWEAVDVAVPYAAGELLARVRERGTVDLEYGNRDVRVRGRMSPGLAGELRSAAERWAATLDAEGVPT